MLNEFDIIERYFHRLQTRLPNDVLLEIGDDAAAILPKSAESLVMSIDTLVNEVHFAATTPPHAIGYKALAVNISDLAAMGAKPRFALLALTLPEISEQWLEQFSQGFFELLQSYQIVLLGGDLTHGPLSITVQVTGVVAKEKMLRRSSAKVGDGIFVTGSLGDAAYALRCQQQQLMTHTALLQRTQQRLDYPTPRVEMGLNLAGVAHAAIDISDGLLADLQHICTCSHLGAEIWLDHLPIAEDMCAQLEKEDRQNLALTGGDDYELCFTAPLNQQELIIKKAKELDLACQQIGVITQNSEIVIKYNDMNPEIMPLPKYKGYQHF